VLGSVQPELAELRGMYKAVRRRVMSKHKKADPRQKTDLMQVLEQRLSNVRLDSSLLFEA